MPHAAEATEAVAIVAAVVKELNDAAEAGKLSKPFVAARLYDPEFELEELKDLHVTVLAARRRSQRLTRDRWEHDYDIEVGVQQQTDRSQADLDEKLRLPAEISTYFDDLELADYPAAVFVEGSIDPLYSPEHLRSFGVFSSVVRLTFRTHEVRR